MATDLSFLDGEEETTAGETQQEVTTQETSTDETSEQTTSTEEKKEASTETEENQTTEVKTETDTTSVSEKDKHVPLAALEAERRKRQELEQQLSQFHQKKEPVEAPDVLENQKGYTDFLSNQVRETLVKPLEQRLESQAEAFARDKFGDEVIDADLEKFREFAEQGIVTPDVFQQIKNSSLPFHEIHKFVERRTELEKMNNIDEWREQERAKLREELKQELQTEQAKKEEEKQKLRDAIPDTLAGKPSAGNIKAGDQFTGPTPMEDIVGE